jgi:hypothetical protein
MTIITIKEINEAIAQNKNIFIDKGTLKYLGFVLIEINDISYIYSGKLEDLNTANIFV